MSAPFNKLYGRNVLSLNVKMSTPSSSQFTQFKRVATVAANPTTTTSVSGVTQFLSSLSNKNGTPFPGWTPTVGQPFTTQVTSTNLGIYYYRPQANKVRYVNGYWVAVGQGGGTGINMYYTKDPSGPWIPISGPFGTAGSAMDIAYGNGIWVVVGCGRDVSGPTGINMYYTRDLASTWAPIVGPFGSGVTSCGNGIAYGGNGYWVAVGASSGNNLWYTRDPTATWTSVYGPFVNSGGGFLGEPDGGGIPGSGNSVAYGNGYWVAVGIDPGSGVKVYSTRNPEDTWSPQTRPFSLGHINNVATYVTYKNGYWVVCGMDNGQLSDGTYETPNCIFYATDPTAFWIPVTRDYFPNLWRDSNCITYANGKWVLVATATERNDTGGNNSYPSVYYATNIHGPWTQVSSNTFKTSINNLGATGIEYGDDGYWVAVGAPEYQSYRVLNRTYYMVKDAILYATDPTQ